MRRDERGIRKPLFEQVAVHGQRNGHIGTGPRRDVQIRLASQRRFARIDHDQPRAALLRLAYVGHEMNPRARRVHAPQNDQFRLGIILVGHRRHLAVERLGGHAGGRRAHGASQA